MTSAYICDYIRTPIGRFGGVLSCVRPDDLGAIVLREIISRNPKVDPVKIDDVILGCANQAGEDNRNVARMSLLLAGIPHEVPGVTVNRLCGSGMSAVSMASHAIAMGEASLVIAGGVESMSRAPFVLPKAPSAWDRGQRLEDTTLGWRLINPKMHDAYGTDSMAETAENVAAEYHVSRTDQDTFSVRSQQRCASALAAGYHCEEIVPVPLVKGTVADRDEHPRPDSSEEKLAKLKPFVRSDGCVTAGNASGINDGAAALLLASEAAVKAYDLSPKARVVGSAVAGVLPCMMGMGPVPAVRKLLEHTGLSINQMDVIELNEAFAAQALAVLRTLGLGDDEPQVNPNGGAIALGHPLGASGARLVMTAVHQMQRVGGRYGLCTMCIGVGQGTAIVLERA